MYSVRIYVYNKFGEIETAKTFTGRSKAAAAMQAGKWCISGWGKDYQTFLTVEKRRVDAAKTTVWEIR
jgi:hypothetical protein